MAHLAESASLTQVGHVQLQTTADIQMRLKLLPLLKHSKADQEDLMPHQSRLNSYASSPDSNGLYTILDLKRADGTLYIKLTLSGGSSSNYITDTWQFYYSSRTTDVLTKQLAVLEGIRSTSCIDFCLFNRGSNLFEDQFSAKDFR